MEIRFEQLDRQLHKELATSYVVYGNEPLLQQEALDSIRSAAKTQGYEERKLYHIDHQFNWDEITAETQTRSLFAAKKIIELRVPSGKLGTKGAKEMVAWCDNPPTDHLLILALGPLDKSAKSSNWYKCLKESGIMVQIWPIKTAELPRWIRQRLQSLQLTIEQEALNILCHHVEGNLLAAHQQIQKLKFSQRTHITVDMVKQQISDSARFTIYQLIEMALQGEYSEASRMLQSLQLEGLQPLNIIAPLTTEIQKLLQLAHHYRLTGGNISSQIFIKNNVWKARQPLLNNALKRLPYNRLVAIHRHAKHLDNGVKGLLKIDIWLELDVLVAMLAGINARDKVTSKLSLERYY